MKKRFNLKRLMSKRNNGGFTLIEVIIAMALLGILVTGVVSFSAPILNMVANNKKNAQANMLSESLNTYIMGQIRGAKIVETFAGQNLENIVNNGLEDSGYKANITTIVHLFPDYEVRCIGMVWMDDESSPVAGRKKLMLVNCQTNDHLDILSTKVDKVFDDSLYDGLYPMLYIDSIDVGGVASDNGYEVTSQIYLNPNCYNVISPDARARSTPNFTGVTYVQCVNLSPAYTKDGQTYPSFTTGDINPGATPESDEAARQQQCIDRWYDWDNGTNGFTDGENDYFYTDTFIFYLAPK